MKRYDDFMCVCNDESKAEAEACYERVVTQMEEDSSEKHYGLLSFVVYGLTWSMPDNFSGGIDGMYCDQWAVIEASVKRYNKDTHKYEDYAGIRVQCDLLEHGLARVWELAQEAIADA